MNWRIPLSTPDYGPEEEHAALRVLRSGWVSMGPEVQAFEAEFAAVIGVPHAIAVSSATAALHLALIACGVGPGDEVIQPALNFVASANMTRVVGATPVFADVIRFTEPLLDPDAVERAISSKTKAVIAMHYGGHVCDLSRFRKRLVVIEDACHGLGVPQVGTLGDVGCFSFFGNKNVATGEGGMLTTHSAAIAEQARSLRSHGMTSSGWERSLAPGAYDVTASGYNYRLDEIHAAIGRVQLTKLAHNNARRRAHAAQYSEELAGLPDWAFTHAEHLMVAIAPNTVARDHTVKQLAEAGIQTSMHYPCIPDLTAFAQHRNSSIGKSRTFSARAMTLPLYATLTTDQISEICAVIKQSQN